MQEILSRGLSLKDLIRLRTSAFFIIERGPHLRSVTVFRDTDTWIEPEDTQVDVQCDLPLLAILDLENLCWKESSLFLQAAPSLCSLRLVEDFGVIREKEGDFTRLDVLMRRLQLSNRRSETLETGPSVLARPLPHNILQPQPSLPDLCSWDIIGDMFGDFTSFEEQAKEQIAYVVTSCPSLTKIRIRGDLFNGISLYSPFRCPRSQWTAALRTFLDLQKMFPTLDLDVKCF
ncbi:hypothetical protein KFL_003780160 [Klebsormidium nitens]|uniref:Uncharacterized protein n=1 Tax=Klebsormidium nitens TaxID=105231 RepID=A0A1Y1IA65_KLENI|nr:hypothetical protein KFL_003780160 [Klebsormidium nitens]|eukprot:GAQ87810.1 hypothetical protein KFL_003780160 [Klebsormidium nitens]